MGVSERKPIKVVVSGFSTTLDWLKTKDEFDGFTFHSSFRDAVQNVRRLQAGDIVCGSFSLRLAARICERGAEYWHINVRKKLFDNSSELGIDELERVAFISSYDITFNEEIIRP